MQVLYKTPDGQFQVTLEARDQVTLFQEIANFQEVFEDPEFFTIAGKQVPRAHVQFRVRTVDKNLFYEKVYVGPDKDLWGFKLPYSQSKENRGALYPQRKISDDEKSKVKDGYGGWRKWIGDKDSRPAVSTSTGVTSPAPEGGVKEVPF